MDFDPTAHQVARSEAGQSLGVHLPSGWSAEDVIASASGAGLIDDGGDFVATTLAVEALAAESAAAAMVLALHMAVVRTLGKHEARALLQNGAVGSLSLSTDQIPSIQSALVTGRASWVGPVTAHGVAIVGARLDVDITARAVVLDAPGVEVQPIETSGLRGVRWAHVTFADTSSVSVGAPADIMALARTSISAIALGIGSRALRECLAGAGRYRGAGGEQTVQGLLADTATELDAARLLVWKAAAARSGPSLADASMAKLAATTAAQGAVARATQVIGVDSFREGHVIERLTQDVRAIELFAGRTEALREAVAQDELPRVDEMQKAKFKTQTVRPDETPG
jgi:alkylation response protein AidB-like acyl-CoA dehydrogenase